MPDKKIAQIEGEVFITHVFANSETVRVRGVAEPIYLSQALIDQVMVGTGRAKVKVERDDENDLVMYEYEVVPDHVVTPHTAPTYTPQRAATVRLTQAIHEYLNVRYPNRPPMPKPEKDIDGYLDLWLGIHGDGGTPGMVFKDTGSGVFDWQIVREARRHIGFATGASSSRAGQILDSLLASAPNADVDVEDIIVGEGVALMRVLYHAVNIAADRFNPDPADPGFSADAHEDALRDACLAYTQAFLARRAHGA